MTQARPFEGLEPNLVLDAVEAFGKACDGHLLALNSYENRVYQVGLIDAAPVVVKFYRPARWTREQLLEEHEFSLELAELELPVVPPLRSPSGETLHEHAGFQVALFERRSGAWPEMFDASRRRWMGRLLGRIHAVGATHPFVHRPPLNAHTFGHEPREFLLSSGALPMGLERRYAEVSGELLAVVGETFGSLGDVHYLRVHGDCHGGNVLWGAAGPCFVDLDDARMAPAVQDLWMFLEGSPDERQGQLLDLLEGYEDFRTFDYRELRLVEALRGLRQLHYAAWLARRWNDPAFPRAFPWFGTENYWTEHVRNLGEQVAATLATVTGGGAEQYPLH